MAAATKTAQAIDTTFTTQIRISDEVGGWTVATMPNSGEFFGTRKPVKIGGTIDGHPFEATLLPTGDGTHMFPIKAALRKTVAKENDETITVHLTQRFS